MLPLIEPIPVFAARLNVFAVILVVALLLPVTSPPAADNVTVLPAALIAFAWSQHVPLAGALGLIWLAHIGTDRLLGYGLKYDDHFQHAHLGMLGGKERVSRAGFTTTRGRIARQPRSS